MQNLNRKSLPSFGVLDNKAFDIDKIKYLCQELNLLDFDKYDDIKVSSDSLMKPFVVSNQFSKNSFFTEDGAEYSEGDKYKQKYLTEINHQNISHVPQETNSSKSDSIFFRMRRLSKENPNYDVFADELNYGSRNHFVTGIFQEILDSFSSRVTRVRLAYLAPEFSIKPHIDYDPSYITRFHIPILTNKLCQMHVMRNGIEQRAHFPADGRVYFLNAGLKHWASNNSTYSRLHLIIDTHGQADLKEHLKEITSSDF